MSDLDELKELIKNNYTNLSKSIESSEKNLSTHINYIKMELDKLVNEFKEDHNTLIKLESDFVHLKSDFEDNNKNEERFGRQFANSIKENQENISKVADSVQSLVISIEKNEKEETKKKAEAFKKRTIEYIKIAGLIIISILTGGGILEVIKTSILGG